MDKKTEAQENTLPSYDHEETPSIQVPAYEEAPSYQAGTSTSAGKPTAGVTLTLDPTATFIKTLPSSDAKPLYTLNRSMLHLHSTSSVHVMREGQGGEEIVLYALGEHFISPLFKPANHLFKNLFAARTHGALVTVGIREIIWDFSTRVPLPPGSAIESNMKYPVDPVYSIGTSPGVLTEKKSLLQYYGGKWWREEDEVVALEREGSVEECGGMPVLSLMKELDQEWMDFLVSCWCCSLWGEVGKRVRRQSKSRGDSPARFLGKLLG